MEKLEPHVASKGNQNAVLKAMGETETEFFAREADALKALCAGWAEIVVFNSSGADLAYAVTEVLNIALVGALIQPLLPTRERFMFNDSWKLPKFMNMFGWWLAYTKYHPPAPLKREIEEWKAANGMYTTISASIARSLLSTDNPLLRNGHKRRPYLLTCVQHPAVYTGCKLPALNPWDQLYRYNAPQICGFSPTSFAPPADWDAQGFDYSITGDWVLAADDLPEKPHAALVQFIEAGEEPPLYIGWGSMAHRSGEYMTELAVRALHVTWHPCPHITLTPPPKTRNPPSCPPFGNHRCARCMPSASAASSSRDRAAASSSVSASTSSTPPSPTRPRLRRGRPRTCSSPAASRTSGSSPRLRRSSTTAALARAPPASAPACPPSSRRLVTL